MTTPLIPLTAEELAALKTLAEAAVATGYTGQLARECSPRHLLRLLAQVQEAEARWDALEESVQQMFQRASGLENGHNVPLDEVLAEMARLEREPPKVAKRVTAPQRESQS